MKLLCLLFLIGPFAISALAQKQGQALVDSLAAELPKAEQDTAAVKLLNALAYNTMYSDPDMSLRYADQAKSLAIRLDWKKGVATAERMCGNVHTTIGEYDKAIKCFEQALEHSEELNDLHGIASNVGNIGTIYHNQGRYAEALDYFFRALDNFEMLGDKYREALQLTNIGLVYEAQSSNAEALTYYQRALSLYREEKNEAGEAEVLVNVANIFATLGKFTEAIQTATEALTKNESLGNTYYAAESHRSLGKSFYQQKRFAEAIDHWYKALPVYVESENKREMASTLANIADAYLLIIDGRITIVPDSLSNKTSMLDKAVRMLNMAEAANAEVGDMYTNAIIFNSLHDAYRLQGDFAKALDYHKRFTDLQDSIFSEKNDQKIKALSRQREEDLKQRRIEMQQLQIASIRRERLLYLIGLVAVLLFSGLVAFLYRRANHERTRSDNLLLNILPFHTANELKENGHSEARLHPDVSVMFTDFVEFSKLTENMPPREMVSLIDHYYKGFDRVIKKHRLEKIKTIGDSYMAACGVPLANPRHAHETVNAALEIMDFVNKEAVKREAKGLPFFHVRIGINSGPVVAGIVGDSKFAYDIWGDTVNFAARMEQSGMPGKVNISGATYDLIKDSFGCNHRGRIKVKHGVEVEMYFVESEVHEAVHA